MNTAAALDTLIAAAKEAQALGEFARAGGLFERALQQSREIFGDTHATTLTLMNSVAVARYYDGRPREARELQEALLGLRKNLFGSTHPQTVTSKINLAWALYADGDLLRSRQLFKKTWHWRGRTLGPAHPDTISALANFAWILQVTGELRKARKLQKRILSFWRDTGGDEHPETINSMETLAATQYATDELQEARDLQERALRYWQERFCLEHHKTLVAKGNLALTLFAQGDFAAARVHQQVVRGTRNKLQGEEHPEALRASANLAMTLHAQGEFAGAQELQTQTLALRRRTAGERHPETFVAMADLAVTLHSLGDLASALELERKVVAGRRRILGKKHPHTLTAITNLSLTLYRLGQLNRSRRLQELVLKLRMRVSGESHTDTLGAIGNLAVIVAAQGNYQRARELHTRALRLREESLGQKHPHTMLSRGELAATLESLGDSAAARPLIQTVVTDRLHVLGAKHPDTIAAMASLALNLSRLEGERAACLRTLETLFQRLSDRETSLSAVTAIAAASVTSLVSELVNRGWDFPWRSALAALSRNWLEGIDVAPPSQVEGLWSHFVEIHATWLDLCVRHCPDDVPLALAALQGREMASALLEELLARRHELSPQDLRSRYLLLLSKLREIRFQLNVLLGDNRGGRGLRSDELGTLTPRHAPTRQQRVLEKKLVEKYDGYFRELTSVKAELARTFPDFSLVAEHKALDIPALSKHLEPSEILVMLFVLPRAEEFLHFACCVECNGTASIIEMPRLAAAVESCNRYEQSLREGSTGRTMRGVLAEGTQAAAPASYPSSSVSLSQVAGTLQEALWLPLRSAHPETNRWHIALHQSLHGLPVAMSAVERAAEEIYLYPGVSFFARRPADVAARSVSALHVDAAWSSAPIPLVEAEAALIQAFVPDVKISTGMETLRHLRSADGQMQAFLATSHGHVSRRNGGQEQAAILIDADQQLYLDGADWLATGARTRLAVLVERL